MKRTLSVTAVAAALLLAPLAVADAAPAAPTYFQNCDQAKAAGQTNIPKGSADYRPALDRDKDNLACDADDRGPATVGAAFGTGDPDYDETDESATEDPGTSNDDGSGDSTSDEGTSDDGTSDEEGTEDSSDSDQVGVVPEGGAPTGDGSTETGFGWWVGGGLLMAMAGAGLALRQRVFGRS